MKKPPDNRLPNGVAMINSLIYDYKRRSKRKGIEFDLSFDEFKDVIFKNCYYCGERPSSIRRKNNKHRLNGMPLYNGIDRVDNEKGYIINNIVPCCKLCNTMKYTLSKKEFVAHIKKILINGILDE